MTEDDSPAARLDRYLAEHDPDLPDRYRYPGRSIAPRPFSPWHVAPLGLFVVAIGLLVGWWLGWPVRP